MPRFSGAYTLRDELGHPRRRRPVLRQARRQRDLLAGQPAAVRARASASRTATSRIRSPAPRPPPRCSATSPRSIRTWTCPRQLQYSIGVQRELPRGPLRRGHLRRQPGAQPALAAEHQHPDVRGGDWRTRCCRPRERANTNFLRPYQGYSNITPAPQRRLLGLQQPAVLSEQAPRRHQVLGQLHPRQGRPVSAAATATTRSTTRAGGRPTTSTCPTSSDRRRSIAGTRSSSSRPTRRRTCASGATSSVRSWAAGRSAARSAGSRAST